MAKSRNPAVVTRKQRGRLERERILRRNLYIGTAFVVVAVVGLIVFGVLQEAVFQPRQPVATVAGEDISTGEFQARVRYQRRLLVNQYLNTLQTMQLFGSDPNTQSFFQNSLQQIEIQLQEPTLLGQQILDLMVEDTLIRQEAARLDLTVEETELDQALEEAFGFFPDGTPTPGIQPTGQPTATLSPTQLALIGPSLTPTEALDTPTPEATPTQAETGTPTPVSSPQPSPTAYTRAAYQADYNSFVDTLSGEIDVSEAEFRAIFASQLYREKVSDAVTADLAQEREEVWARHILVDELETAEQVLERLDQGEDWAALAAELSTDESNKDRGGDLGWFGTGRMVAEFEQAAFSLEIGEISEPVETQFGWHIIQVLGREVRPVSAAEYEQLRSQSFQEWLTEAVAQAEVEINPDWVNRVPDDPALPPLTTGGLPPVQVPTQPDEE